MNAGASLSSLPSSFQARHQPVAPNHPSDIGRYIRAEGGKGFPPALEAEAAGLQLSLSWPGDSPPLPGVWFKEITLEEARPEAFKAKFICKEIRLKMENV